MQQDVMVGEALMSFDMIITKNIQKDYNVISTLNATTVDSDSTVT